MIPSTINHHSFQEYRGLLIFKHHNKQTTPRLPTILGVILYHYFQKGYKNIDKIPFRSFKRQNACRHVCMYTM